MRLRLVGAYYHGSMEGVTTPWACGEERDVPEATGTYLLSVRPCDFERLDEPKRECAPVVVAPASPPVDRAIKSPKLRK